MRPTTATNATNAHNELEELAHDPIKELELLTEDAISLAGFVLASEEGRASQLMSSALLWFAKANKDHATFIAMSSVWRAQARDPEVSIYNWLEEAVISSVKTIDYSVGRLSGYYKTALFYTARASELIAEISELHEKAQ
jgi:hypothetical protein